MAEEAKNIKKVERGGLIFQKGQRVNQIALLIKGNVIISDEYMEVPLQAGSIIGILDIDSQEYLHNYVAADDSAVCLFEYKTLTDIGAVGSVLQSYRNYTIQSACNQLEDIIDIYETLSSVTKKLYSYITDYYEDYKKLCSEYMKKAISSQDIENLSYIDTDNVIDSSLIRYFQSLTEIPEDIFKAFFEADDDVTGYNIQLASGLAVSISDRCTELYAFYNKTFELLYSKGVNNVFAMYSKLAMDISAASGDITKIMHEMDKIIALISECRDLMQDTLGLEFKYDFSRINDICNAIKKQSNKISEDKKENDNEMLLTFSDAQINEAVSTTKDALKKILAFSQIEQEKADMFEKYLTVYRGLKDPLSTEDDVRKLRLNITAMYYEIYEKVFFYAEDADSHNRLIDMFLNYGFMDENMLDRETVVSLFYLDTEIWNGRTNVYLLRQWLHAIYAGEKEPSKNEFDLDYEENFRELKKTQNFTSDEERKYFNDTKAKVHYELVNMVKTNNRLTNGQLTTFCPILKQADFYNSVEKMHISGQRVEDALLNIIKIDFSAFYREYLYEDNEHKITKLNLMKEVLPDIIFMPNAGHKGSMWQEIAGKRRDSAGRFILPAFTMENLDDIMLKLVGAFRWELCRTIQGTYWNDVREKSLTAEYSDYIQFYKKNRELSDEAKEKIKTQMQRCRNNTREMFTKDYEIWIKNESMGMTRVNKIVRLILFAYCPFSKEYRKRISEQPMFRDGVAKYERERLKKIKELNNRFTAIRNSGGEVTELLQQNMDYLKEQ